MFVSYSHNNSSVVFPELVWLRESGFNIWYDEGIEAGTEWREELAKAIEGAKLLLYFVTSDSVQSENCRKEVNFAVDEGIPIVAIHLEAVELPSGLKLTLSDRQAILKHEIPKAEYEQKLQSRISSYLDQEIVQPVQRQESKSTPVLVGVAVVLVLVIGLFVYNQQTVKQPVETATGQATEGIPSEQPTSNSNEKFDWAAMHSVAVLPFANMTTSEETGYFSEGMSEDILDNLARTKGLRVSSRSDSFRFARIGETEKAKSILANSRVELTNHYYLALGHLALGDVDNTFKAIEAGITNRNQFLPATLLVGEWFDPIRDDPRFDEMLELLDSGVTHTEQYLRDHNIGQQELQL